MKGVSSFDFTSLPLEVARPRLVYHVHKSGRNNQSPSSPYTKSTHIYKVILSRSFHQWLSKCLFLCVHFIPLQFLWPTHVSCDNWYRSPNGSYVMVLLFRGRQPSLSNSAKRFLKWPTGGLNFGRLIFGNRWSPFWSSLVVLVVWGDAMSVVWWMGAWVADLLGWSTDRIRVGGRTMEGRKRGYLFRISKVLM